MTAMPPTRRASYPWLPGGGLGILAFAVYALLPEIAPRPIAGTEQVVLLGILLGVVVGIATRLEATFTPAIALGSAIGMSVQLHGDQLPLVVALLLGPAVGAEILAVATLLRRSGASRLSTPADVFRLVAISTAASVVTGVVAAGIIALGGVQFDSTSHYVRSWSIDDTFGLVCIVPAILTLHRPTRWNWNRSVEYSLVVVLTAVATYFVFWVVTPGEQGVLGWPYIVVLGPIWISVRFGVAAVAPVVAMVFWLAAIQSIDGQGAFVSASASPVDRLAAVQLFAIVMTATVLILGVLRDDRLRSLTRVHESARLLREVIDGSDSLIFAKSYADDAVPRGRYELVNRTWSRVTGLSKDATLGRSDAELFPTEVADAFSRADQSVLSSNEQVSVHERNPSVDRGMRIYASSRFPLRDEEGRSWGVGGIATDITDSEEARDRERRSTELLRAVFEQSPTPAVRLTMDENRTVTVFDANAAMCTLMGAAYGEVSRCDLMAHIHPDDVATAWDIITFAVSYAGTHSAPSLRQRELRLRTVDGRTVWVLMSAAAVGNAGVGAETELVAQFEDFTARRAAEEALSDQAMRDAVTGLPNRRALRERMELALHRLRRHPGHVTVLFCDLDRFKDVNDSLGHHVGDRMLIDVADRLKSALRPEDMIARLGGDEFVALGEALTEASDAVLMALRLQDRLSAPWVFEEQVFRPAMSVGIAMTSDPDMSVDELLRRADLAMYRAKEDGRNRVEVYERAVDEEIQSAVALQHDLRRAIDTGGLVLHYQPIVELAGLSVVAAEALVRMVSSDGGIIPPGLFVPQAETTGLVVPLGAWVIQQSLADLRQWRQAGRDIGLSVNVSPSQLRDEGFASYLLEQLQREEIDPAWLSVEVTETALIHDPGRSARELGVLSDAGIGISLDDFGTGYSSLTWLTQFPVNVVKIDKSFTDEIGIDDRKTAIVSAVVQVSHELGFTVVAEGVETVEQRDRLLELGADRGQGYLFGRPVPVADLA